MKPCPFCGSAARRYTYPAGIRCQVRCRNVQCKARGPLVELPYPYVPRAVDYSAASLEERRQLQKQATDLALEKVKAEAERAWNERAE